MCSSTPCIFGSVVAFVRVVPVPPFFVVDPSPTHTSARVLLITPGRIVITPHWWRRTISKPVNLSRLAFTYFSHVETTWGSKFPRSVSVISILKSPVVVSVFPLLVDRVTSQGLHTCIVLYTCTHILWDTIRLIDPDPTYIHVCMYSTYSLA